MRARVLDPSRPARDRRPASARPISCGDLSLTEDTITAIAPDWTVERIVTSPSDTSLVIMPEGADDLIGPTLIISHGPRGYCLERLHWDELSSLGDYPTLRQAIAAVVTLLQRLAFAAATGSISRH